MEPAESLATVEIEPEAPARAAVIWLHGLGADGHDFEPIVPYLGLGPDLPVRFVFPHAPRRAVTINMGLIMPAWYDIRGLDLEREEDTRGLADSVALVRALVARENERGVAPERIVVAGFSQGGAVALHLALTHAERLAGALALSTYIPGAERLERELAAANRGLPILQAHGTLDPMVPIERGEQARQWLVERGFPVDWQAYPMGHEVCPQEIEAIGGWLSARLA